MTPEQINRVQAFIQSRSNDANGCIEWTGSLDTNGCPVLRLPGQVNKEGNPRVRGLFTPVRRAILQMKGIDIGTKLASTKCVNPLCIDEEHIVPMTRKELQKRTAKLTGYGANPRRKAALAKAARARISVLTEETVQEMRNSGLSSRKAAKAYGVCQSTASDALAHRTWKNYSNPFIGLMA